MFFVFLFFFFFNLSATPQIYTDRNPPSPPDPLPILTCACPRCPSSGDGSWSGGGCPRPRGATLSGDAVAPAQPVARRGRHRTASSSRALRSEEHTSELQSLMRTWYAVFGWKKKTTTKHKVQNSR